MIPPTDPSRTSGQTPPTTPPEKKESKGWSIKGMVESVKSGIGKVFSKKSTVQGTGGGSPDGPSPESTQSMLGAAVSSSSSRQSRESTPLFVPEIVEVENPINDTPVQQVASTILNDLRRLEVTRDVMDPEDPTTPTGETRIATIEEMKVEQRAVLNRLYSCLMKCSDQQKRAFINLFQAKHDDQFYRDFGGELNNLLQGWEDSKTDEALKKIIGYMDRMDNVPGQTDYGRFKKMCHAIGTSYGR